MRFPLSDDALRRLLGGLPIGDVPPFDQRPRDESDPAYVLSETARHEFVERVIDDLVSLPDFTVDREHHPCAWSTYAALRWTLSRRRGEEASAVVWLCRLAPVAVYCAGRDMAPRRAYELPDDAPSSTLRAHLTEVLEYHQVALVPRTELDRPLPFDARVDTNVRPGPFTVFDAMFRWND